MKRCLLTLALLVCAAPNLLASGELPPSEAKRQLLNEWERFGREVEAARVKYTQDSFSCKAGNPLRHYKRTVLRFVANADGYAAQEETEGRSEEHTSELQSR